jgi:hypothetical protein
MPKCTNDGTIRTCEEKSKKANSRGEREHGLTKHGSSYIHNEYIVLTSPLRLEDMHPKLNKSGELP